MRLGAFSPARGHDEHGDEDRFCELQL